MNSKLLLSILTCVLSLFNSLWSHEYQLTIAMVFQNEAPYLKEWIEYHRLLGVEHFYLFNHYSTDNYKKVLAPYIKKGIVELYQIDNSSRNFNKIQVGCYNKILKKAAGVSKWVAMIDADEFLVIPKEYNINDLLKNYESFGGIVISWRNFGTSNVAKIPPDKLMIECLIRCASPDYVMNAIVKSIVRPECATSFAHPHWPEFAPGWFAVDTDGVQFLGAGVFNKDKLWINHYWTRDEDFLINHKIPRRLKWGWDAEAVWKTANDLNAVTDDCILHYVPQLRKKVFKNK